MSTVGERIRIARIRVGLTQTDLAKVLGLMQSDISFAENNKEPLPPEILEKAEAVLKVRMDHPDWERFFAMFSNGHSNFDTLT
jgi:transcriptional regulator with XRE-family HTH domain